MSGTQSKVFQVDHDLILKSFKESDNYLIQYNKRGNKEKCVIYFSSNNIYYPNEPQVFQKDIVEKNRFEWYGARITDAHKHILIRDIKKQWFLNGINEEINTPTKLFDFLKRETEGFKNIVTLGSSAGGYAAVLFGQQLNANLIYSFNGQFEVNSQLEKSKESIDPLIFRYKDDTNLRGFYDIKKYITNPKTILYFTSAKSSWDMEQQAHISDLKMQTFSFSTSHHGIPFIKSILPKLLNMDVDELIKHKGGNINPILFSIRVGGLMTTYKGLKKIILDKLK